MSESINLKRGFVKPNLMTKYFAVTPHKGIISLNNDRNHDKYRQILDKRYEIMRLYIDNVLKDKTWTSQDSKNIII